LRKVKLHETVVPPEVKWSAAMPRMMASNNWVIAGSKTRSGKPMLANDPHLEIRLPNVWCEVILETPSRYAIGATIPGLPAMLVGRTPDLAWGATYTFMDTVDAWSEHCKGGRYRRGDAWEPFRVRQETIRRKKKPAHEVVFHENEHGVLEGDPGPECYLLTTRWSASRSGARSIVNVFGLCSARHVEEGRERLGAVGLSFSWGLARRGGNIGFQMSGLMHKRREGVSGFVPLPGWDPANDWQGFVDPKDLPRVLNPAQGFFVTANQDLNAHGKAKPINMPMGDYRARRIEALLAAGSKFAVGEIEQMHYDVVSPQAEAFMAILKPLLPDSENGRKLRDWDCRYTPESEGATIFERLYRELLREAFGAKGGLEGAFDFLSSETGTFIDFYANFDRILLSERSAWFGGGGREQVFRAAIERSLAAPARRWGEVNRITLTNILFGGKLPRFLGFDRGPIPIRGGRATIHQGQIYRTAGRATSFIPSFRIVIDMAEDASHSNLAGGVSDRRFSAWYDSETEAWLTGRYKKLEPSKG